MRQTRKTTYQANGPLLREMDISSMNVGSRGAELVVFFYLKVYYKEDEANSKSIFEYLFPFMFC